MILNITTRMVFFFRWWVDLKEARELVPGPPGRRNSQ